MVCVHIQKDVSTISYKNDFRGFQRYSYIIRVILLPPTAIYLKCKESAAACGGWFNARCARAESKCEKLYTFLLLLKLFFIIFILSNFSLVRFPLWRSWTRHQSLYAKYLEEYKGKRSKYLRTISWLLELWATAKKA